MSLFLPYVFLSISSSQCSCKLFLWGKHFKSSIKYIEIYRIPFWPPFFLIFVYLFLAALGLRRGVRASHCGGFSCCGARALGTWAQ